MRRRDWASLVVLAGAVLATAWSVWAVSAPGWHFPHVFLALLIWSAVALAWLVLSVIHVLGGMRNSRTRAVVLWLSTPALVLATLLVCSTGVPERARLELSRPTLDEVALDVSRGRRAPPGDGRLALYRIYASQRIENGFAFLVEGAGFIDSCGLAYGRRGEPSPPGASQVWHISGRWYGWCEDF